MKKHYIFTVTSGRSGQKSLYNVINKNSKNCFADFEAPNIKPYLPSLLGNIEKKIRRQYFNGNELLGRGKILRSYETSDIEYIKKIANKRLKIIKKKMAINNSSVYFDVSKFYARGLYLGFNSLLKNYSIVFLVRDPLLNMKSFLNRNKNFLLDNSLPQMSCNELIMNHKNFSQGEYYLWSWSEIYMRYLKISNSKKVIKNIKFYTEDLESTKKLASLFNKLNIHFDNITDIKKVNTNNSIGIADTIIEKKDVNLLKMFIKKIPKMHKKIIHLLQKSLAKHES